MSSLICSRNISNVLVTVGAHNIEIEEPTQQRRNIGVENMKLHEDFVAVLAQNDLGIITLDDSIEFNERVQPVTLPSWKDVRNQYVAKDVIVSG